MHDFITVTDAARLVGISEVAVRDAVQKDEIIGGKVGGRYIVSKQSALAYKPRPNLRRHLPSYYENVVFQDRIKSALRRLAILRPALANCGIGGPVNTAGVSYFQIGPIGHRVKIYDVSAPCRFALSEYWAISDDEIEGRIETWASRALSPPNVESATQ
jgi:hypothetical protein